MSESDDKVLEALAAAAHEVFCDGLRAQGFRYGPDSDAYMKTHTQLKPFADLSPWERDEYRERLRQVPELLALAGYRLDRAADTDALAANATIDVERLASIEHQRWLRRKLDDGWRYSPRTDPAQRLHSALVPWRPLSEAARARLPAFEAAALGPGELPEKKKEVCRDLVRGLPELLSKAGYAATSIAPAPTGPLPEPGSSPSGVRADVFISARSLDYEHAQAVYDFLVDRAVTVFFSRESLPELGISDYRKQIDQALEEATHLIVVTSSVDNVRAPWVEAEWGFFINEKRSGRKSGNLVTIVVGDLKPADLPPSLRYYEVIPFSAIERVLGFVKGPAGFRHDGS